MARKSKKKRRSPKGAVAPKTKVRVLEIAGLSPKSKKKVKRTMGGYSIR